MASNCRCGGDDGTTGHNCDETIKKRLATCPTCPTCGVYNVPHICLIDPASLRNGRGGGVSCVCPTGTTHRPTCHYYTVPKGDTRRGSGVINGTPAEPQKLFAPAYIPPATHYAEDCYCVSCFSFRVTSNTLTPLDYKPGVKRPESNYFEYERCMDCGWRMGDPAKPCIADNEPHVFPSTIPRVQKLRDDLASRASESLTSTLLSAGVSVSIVGTVRNDVYALVRGSGEPPCSRDERPPTQEKDKTWLTKIVEEAMITPQDVVIETAATKPNNLSEVIDAAVRGCGHPEGTHKVYHITQEVINRVTDDVLKFLYDPEPNSSSREQCVRCGWVMGTPPLNCQNDDTPHRFLSQMANEVDLHNEWKRRVEATATEVFDWLRNYGSLYDKGDVAEYVDDLIRGTRDR